MVFIRHRRLEDSPFTTLDESKNMPFSLQNSFLAIFMLISQRPVQRRGIGEKCSFATRRLSPKVNKVTDLF